MVKEQNAYMTIEATLVLAIVFGIQLLGIYLFVFQYNRCLLTQDAERLVVLGVSERGEPKEALGVYLQKKANEIYREKYLACNISGMEIALDGNAVSVSLKGEMTLPVFGIEISPEENAKEIATERKAERLSESVFLRLIKKGKELAASE
jgi:hypothetical protein